MAPVAVIGAGWAGLSAALRLAEAALPVVLIEASASPGGRARSLDLDGARLDNGQHILVGACRQVLAQMRSLGVDPSVVLESLPFGLSLQSRADAGEHFQLSPASTKPWSLAAALNRALREDGPATRLAAVAGAARMLYQPLRHDLSVLAWLQARHQPPRLIRNLWEPLCLAVMNAPAAAASARVFQNVLRQTLLGRADDARLLIPRRPLGELFPEPAIRRLRQFGTEIRMPARVTGLQPRTDGGFTLTLRGGEAITASRVVVATPHRAALRLLPDSEPLQDTRRALDALGQRSICTVYLNYGRALHGLRPLTGLLGQHGQWLVPRDRSGAPHWLAVVISAAEEFPAADAGGRWRQVAEELAATVPGLGLPERAQVVCETMATFDARPGIDDRRPQTRSGMPGIYLAGDYCVPGLPSTLEAAVQGGLQAAAALLSDLRQP
jgi:squalene-associated FAD-dependent desaturase